MASSRAADIEVVVVPREGAGEGEQSPASNATASPSFVSCDEGSPARWESSSSPSCSSCSSGSGRSSAQENPVRPDGLAEIVHWSPKDDCEGEGDDGRRVGRERGRGLLSIALTGQENEPLFRAWTGARWRTSTTSACRGGSRLAAGRCELCHGASGSRRTWSFLPRTAICTVAADSVEGTALFNLRRRVGAVTTRRSCPSSVDATGEAASRWTCQFPAFPTGV